MPKSIDAPTNGVIVDLNKVSKYFADVPAVNGVSAQIREIGRASCRERV